MSKFNLNGKLAVITGGAGLLGVQHTLAILENKGSVVIIDINKKKMSDLKRKFSKLGYDVNFFYGDVSSFAQVNKIKNKIIKKYKKVDILINNAQKDFVPKKKSLSPENLFEQYSSKKWDNEINIGLRGAFVCSQVFGSEMVKNKNGVILNIASDLSVIAPDQRLYSHLKTYKPVTY